MKRRKYKKAKLYRTKGKADLACLHYNQINPLLFHRVIKAEGFRLWKIVITDIFGNQTTV